MSTAAITKTAATEDWWTQERETYFKLRMQGKVDTDIAQELGVHRNTLREWRNNPAFLARVAEHETDVLSAVQARRQRGTISLTDGAQLMAQKAQAELMKDPGSYDKARLSIALNDSFARMRERERQELGITNPESVVKVQHSGAVIHATAHLDFRRFVTERGVANLQIEGTPEQVVAAMLMESANRTDVIDVFDAEDAPAEKSSR